MKLILPILSLALVSTALPTSHAKSSSSFFTIFGSGMPNSIVPGRDAETRSELENIQLEERADAAAASQKKLAVLKSNKNLVGTIRKEAEDMIRRITVERCGTQGC